MNHRWQKLVMYLTASLIICLEVYGHLQKQQALHERSRKVAFPGEIPQGFLWPKEIKAYQQNISQWEKEGPERERLLFLASQQGLLLDPNDSLGQWQAQLDISSDKSRATSIQEYIEKYSITTFFAPQSKEDEPKRWNLALTGLDMQSLDGFDVMTYELTHATAWFLGFPVSEEEMKCAFCSTTLSFAQAQDVADTLSKSMSLSPCYEQNIPMNECMGWRLPTKQEWEFARGAMEQKWEYLQIDRHPERFDGNRAGRGGENEHGLFDIVGNEEEWLQNGKSIGFNSIGEERSPSQAGVRFYRSQVPRTKDQ